VESVDQRLCWTMRAFASAFEVMRPSRGLPGPTEARVPALPVLASSDLRLACLLVSFSMLGASGCTPGYLDVTSRVSEESPGVDAASPTGKPADRKRAVPRLSPAMRCNSMVSRAAPTRRGPCRRTSRSRPGSCSRRRGTGATGGRGFPCSGRTWILRPATSARRCSMVCSGS